MPTRSVITIGNFDGVHLGHAALLRAARARADAEGSRVVALAFDPHPMTRLRPAHAPPRIMGFARRAELLRALGADSVERLEPTEALLSRTAEAFVADLVERFHPSAFVEGSDFRFGKGRAGDNTLLERLGQAAGFCVTVVPGVEVPLSDHTLAPVSSSLCRWLLAHGRVADAARVLGREHELTGVVITGDRLGRTIGFPTANLATDDLLPADGVYAAIAELPDGSSLPAAVNVGTRPTVNGSDRRVEAHLIRTDLDAPWAPLPGLAEYGWPLRLRFTAFLRDQVRFSSIDELRSQLVRDRARAARPFADPRRDHPADHRPQLIGGNA